MKRLLNKLKSINGKIEDLKNDLFIQALPHDSKNDYYKLCDAMKTFIDNLPQK